MKTLVNRPEFEDAAIAVCPSETVIWEAVQRSGAPWIQRSEESVKKGQPLNVIFGAVVALRTPYVLWVNPCQPFVRNATILEAARRFLDDAAMESMTAVRELKTCVWDRYGVPITDGGRGQYRTDRMQHVYAATHTFHIWNKERMLDRAIPWEQLSDKDPALFTIRDSVECLDADTIQDFEVVRAVWATQPAAKREAIFANG